MIALILMFLSSSSFAETAAPAPKAGNRSLEFDSTVIEGSGHGFSGVTSLRTRFNTGSAYSRSMNFKNKIKDSTSEVSDISVQVRSGEPK